MEYLEILSTIQFEPKIFHPDLSLVTQSSTIVCIGVFIFLLLVIRRCFPMTSFCRYTLRGFSASCLTIHAWCSFLLWLAIVIEGKAQERNVVLMMGVNVFLFILNRGMMRDCDRLLRRRVKEVAYRKAMDDAVAMYQVNEAQCREVITDAKTMEAFLKLIHNELNLKKVHQAEQRIAKGKLAFDDLLAKARLHRNLIDGLPQKAVVLLHTDDNEEDDDGDNMADVD